MTRHVKSAVERIVVPIVGSDEREVVERRRLLRKIQGLQVGINRLEAEQAEAIAAPTGDQYTSDPEPLHEPRSNPLPDNDSPPF